MNNLGIADVTERNVVLYKGKAVVCLDQRRTGLLTPEQWYRLMDGTLSEHEKDRAIIDFELNKQSIEQAMQSPGKWVSEDEFKQLAGKS